MEFRHLTAAELPLWAELCGQSFNCPPDLFLEKCTTDPYTDLTMMFAAFEGGRPVSAARVLDRSVCIGGTEVKMGGIGEVCTTPEYRRQGLSGRLLELCIGEMESRGYPISFLFTGVNSHYARYGWMTCPLRFAFTNGEGGTPAGELSLTRDYTDAMHRLYCAFAARHNGMLVHSQEYRMARFPSGQADRVVLRGGDGLLAYLRGAGSDGVFSFSETVFAETLDPSLIPGLLRAAARLYGSDAPLLRLPAALLPASIPGCRRFEENRGFMARLNLPFDTAGGRVASDDDLARALAQPLFFGIDGF